MTDPTDSRLERSVEGVVTIMRSDTGRDCKCCEGHHVFAYGIDLPGEPQQPGSRGPRVAHPEDWLRRVLYPLRERVDGAKVRITITIEGPDD